MRLAFGDSQRVQPSRSSKRLFSFVITTGLHPLARVQPDCVEEKGYTVSVKARGNYPQQSVVLVESASTGVKAT